MAGYQKISASAICWILALSAAGQAAEPQSDAFDVPAIIALSDADMVASAYADGRLGPPAGTDTMTVLAFDGHHVAPTTTATLPVSNSVTGPPAPMAITPDGRYAITVETRGPRPASGEDVGLANLSKGRRITVVDLHDLAHPRVVQLVDGPPEAETVSINADGSLVALAVATDEHDTATPLWLYRFVDGRLVGGAGVAIPDWKPGHDLRCAIFAPRSSRLALLDATTPSVALFDVTASAGTLALKPWGDPVEVEKFPMIVAFAPDENYLFVNAYYAGDPVPKPPFGFPNGTLTAIRLHAQDDDHGRPVHLVTSHQAVGRGPEGMAVSPDGTLVLSVDMEGSYFPPTDPRRTRYSTLTLFRLNPITGNLDRQGSFPFDGVLPESAVFDRTGKRIAVAVFSQFDDPTAPGWIDFWRVVDDPLDPKITQLVRTHQSISLPRGAMQLSVPGQR